MVFFRRTYWQKRSRLEKLLLFISILSTLCITILAIIYGVILHKLRANTDICLKPECIHIASKILDYIDTSVDPCDDFYDFTCGTFMKTEVIPDDMSVTSTSTETENLVYEQLKSAIEEPIQSKEIKAISLVKKLYQACMNTTAIENIGLKEIKSFLKRHGEWPILEGDNWNQKNFDWMQVTSGFDKDGFQSNFLISINIAIDNKNSRKRIISIDEPILGMNREFLINGLEDRLVKGYYEYMVDVAVIFGASKNRAEKELLESLQFEIKLANITLSQEELQNPRDLYNPMSIKELQDKYQHIPWLKYINAVLAPYVTVTNEEIISITAPKFVSEFESLINSTSKRVLSNYLLWRTIESSIEYLPDKLRKRQFQHRSLTSGKVTQNPRWEQCIELINEELYTAVGALYVRNYFSASAKRKVEDLTISIQDEFREILHNVDWMDQNTKDSALEKLAAMERYIGYPDEVLDDIKLNQYYEMLEVDNENLLKSALNVTKFYNRIDINKLRLPVNDSYWVYRADVAVVNAFYNSLENSMELPAGILQGIFFHEDRPNYMNYGGIGYTAGHEIIHGFDNQGKQYDKDGNLMNWWANKTEEAYYKKTSCIINQYNNYTVPEVGLQINGLNTLSENIADIAGIKVAHAAYEKFIEKNGEDQRLPGLNYSGKQMFWISTGLSWCTKKRLEALKKQIITNVHAPAKFRVWGSVSNMPEFAQDFQCKLNTKMNPEKKCQLW